MHECVSLPRLSFGHKVGEKRGISCILETIIVHHENRAARVKEAMTHPRLCIPG